nr:integrase, catalytic region, zinc finger, CCHC-type, peptidase aspartic, catalytic [Tanacetum cinerariifolium]
MARQCPKPKRKRDATWFKEKVLSVKAQGNVRLLLDVYDSDCDEISTAKTEKEAMNIDKEIDLEKKVKELDNIVYKMGKSAQTVHMIMKPQVFYDNNLKQALGFQNSFHLKKAQQIRLMLYDGSVIAKETNVISIADSKETLMLKEERMYKIDPVILAPKVNNNREAHEYYLKHIMEQVAILREHHVKGAKALCSVCNKCLFDVNHAMCLIDHVRAKSASKKIKKRKEWKPTGKVFNSVRYKWKPTRRTSTLVRNVCPLTRLTTTNKAPRRVRIPLEVVAPKHVVTRVYIRRPKVPKSVQNSKPKVVQIVLWYLDSGRSKHIIEDRSQLTNFVHKFLGTVKFGNDQVVKIIRPMRVASVNGKKYILVIVDDYSLFTWVKFQASKDEAPDFIIKFLKMIQIRLNATVRNIRTYNGTDFVNQTLRDYNEQVGISHETSVARTPQQNGVVDRRNRTLVKAI